jgi:hypothetical protein
MAQMVELLPRKTLNSNTSTANKTNLKQKKKEKLRTQRKKNQCKVNGIIIIAFIINQA